MGQCPTGGRVRSPLWMVWRGIRPSPVIISRHKWTPNGQFEMRFVEPDGSGSLRVLGEISDNGKVYVRQMENSCAYDFVWQK